MRLSESHSYKKLTFSRASSSPGALDVTQKTEKRLSQTAGIAPFCRAGSDSRCVTDGLPELLGVFRTQAPGRQTTVEGRKAGGDTEIHSWRQEVFATRQANFFAALGPGPAWRKALLGQIHAEEQDEQIVPAIEHKPVTRLVPAIEHKPVIYGGPCQAVIGHQPVTRLSYRQMRFNERSSSAERQDDGDQHGLIEPRRQRAQSLESTEPRYTRYSIDLMMAPAIEHKVVESKHERDARHARAFQRSLPQLRRYTRR